MSCCARRSDPRDPKGSEYSDESVPQAVGTAWSDAGDHRGTACGRSRTWRQSVQPEACQDKDLLQLSTVDIV